jgi:uncharacterized protein (TIGR02646 family)
VIPIERGAPPASLDGDDTAGQREREKAIALYVERENRTESFPFVAYKAKDVKAAIDSMFFNKCAYCESYYANSAPVDVEHYRPKGEIKLDDGRTIKPGYYWLAASWTNLLPSCIYCNRASHHEEEDGSNLRGKASKFPLLNEDLRAHAPGEEDRELPYLLDPCKDDPDEHLEFIEEGVIRASLNGDRPSARGERSIEILGLDRPGLAKKRRDYLILVDGVIRHFSSAVKKLNRDPDDSEAEAEVRFELKELMRLMGSEMEFAGMARQRIRPVLKAVGITVP